MSEKIPSLETQTATHASGREHTFEVKEKQLLGRGNFGDVYEVTATFKKETSKEDTEAIERVKERIFALKDFRGDENQAARSLERREMLHAIGVPTYATYRQAGESSILMTHLNKDNTLTLSSSTSDISLASEKLSNIHEITGIKEAVSQMVEHLI